MMHMSATFASHLMTFIGYTSSAATPFYEELARLTGGHYLKPNEFEHTVTLMECVMHRGRSVEPLKVRNRTGVHQSANYSYSQRAMLN